MEEIHGFRRTSSKSYKILHFASDEAWTPTKCMQRHPTMPISLAMSAYWPSFAIAVAQKSRFDRPALWPGLGLPAQFSSKSAFPRIQDFGSERKVY